MTPEMLGLIMGGLSMLGGLFVLVNKAERAVLVEKIENVGHRLDDLKTDLGHYALMAQMVPDLKRRIEDLEHRRRGES